MTSINRGNHLKQLLAMLSIGLCITAIAGCGKSNSPANAAMPPPSLSLDASPTLGNTNHEPVLPKVPFGNQPCQTLSAGDRQNLGLSTTTLGKADRAPATLPFDNLCFYGGIHFGYMTEDDYKVNQEGNRSTSRMAPADLPGAFYDQQGGLWIAKNGYYVVISGSHDLDEKIANVISAKL
jgi:hypothetical protein